jgi:WD40 repeat protein
VLDWFHNDHKGTIHSIAVSNNGKYVASGTQNEVLEILLTRLEDGAPFSRYNMNLTDDVDCLFWHPSDKWIVANTSEEILLLRSDIENGRSIELMDEMKKTKLVGMNFLNQLIGANIIWGDSRKNSQTFMLVGVINGGVYKVYLE